MDVNHLIRNFIPFLKRNLDRFRSKLLQNQSIYGNRNQLSVLKLYSNHRYSRKPILDGKVERFLFRPEHSNLEKEDAIIWNFSSWKRPATIHYLSDFRCAFVEARNDIFPALKTLSTSTKRYYIWGYSENKKLKNFWAKENIHINRIEDGFLRSVELGATLSEPLSFAIDGETLYYDARTPSNLEKILSTYQFKDNPELLGQAELLADLIRLFRLSKYNQSDVSYSNILPAKNSDRRILVLGQVEDDASILYGGGKGWTNEKLLNLAKQENPKAKIIYKPHPDVLQGYRVGKIKELEKDFLILSESVILADLFSEIDHVYTITSLSGFEALLHGKTVTAVGYPFYAGWGLTDDRNNLDRRNRKLTFLEIFAAAYILYPKYLIDPENPVVGALATTFRIHGERRIKTLQAFTPRKLRHNQERISKSNYWPLLFDGHKGNTPASMLLARNTLKNSFPKGTLQETVALKIFRRDVLGEPNNLTFHKPLSQTSGNISELLDLGKLEQAEKLIEDCYLDNRKDIEAILVLLFFTCKKKAFRDAEFLLSYLTTSSSTLLRGEMFFLKSMIQLLNGRYFECLGDISISMAIDPTMLGECEIIVDDLPSIYQQLPIIDALRKAWISDHPHTNEPPLSRSSAFLKIKRSLAIAISENQP